MKKFLLIAAVLMAGMSLAACDEMQQSSTQKEKVAQEQLANQAATTLGLPAIKNFTEKRLLKTIFELRDQANVVTYTYTTDMQGKLHKVCPTNSIGFPIPYSTQYTNPQRVESRQTVHESVVLPQADPNALFSPANAEGTWIVCVNPTTKEMAPTYIEDRVRTYLFPMLSLD